jgi:hypothetical protein
MADIGHLKTTSSPTTVLSGIHTIFQIFLENTLEGRYMYNAWLGIPALLATLIETVE